MMNKFLALIFSVVCPYVYAALPPTTSRGNGDSANITTFNFQFPNISVTHTGTTASFGVVNIAGGGTNKALTLSAGGVPYFDADSFEVLAAGTSGTFLKSNGASAPSWASPSTVSPYVAKTGNYTLDASTDGTVVGNTSGGAFTLTLPTAVGITGTIFRIVKGDTSSNLLSVATTSGQTLSGLSSTKLDEIGETIAVQSDGANWVLLTGTTKIKYITAGGASYPNACTGSPCTIHRQSGSWVSSITRTGAGSYTINIVSGIFSTIPTCMATPGPGLFMGIFGGTPTTTTYYLLSQNNAGTFTDSSIDMTCMGQR
jgi:hypothetical protein